LPKTRWVQGKKRHRPKKFFSAWIFFNFWEKLSTDFFSKT
jgi:hypothetical protein